MIKMHIGLGLLLESQGLLHVKKGVRIVDLMAAIGMTEIEIVPSVVMMIDRNVAMHSLLVLGSPFAIPVSILARILAMIGVIGSLVEMVIVVDMIDTGMIKVAVMAEAAIGEKTEDMVVEMTGVISAVGGDNYLVLYVF